MVISLNVLKGVIRTIVGFIAVYACVKRPFLVELCCYQNNLSIKRYFKKDLQSIYGTIFDSYVSKSFKIGHNYG